MRRKRIADRRIGRRRSHPGDLVLDTMDMR